VSLGKQSKQSKEIPKPLESRMRSDKEKATANALVSEKQAPQKTNTEAEC
jgi:hypothetical protein